MKYGGYTYFRKYSEENFEESGPWDQFYPIAGSKSAMVRMDSNGGIKELFKDDGYGKIFIQLLERGFDIFMKKRIFLLIALLFCICLTACQKSGPSEKNQQTNINIENKENEKETEGEIIIRKDDYNLMEVHIEDGKASAYFIKDNWVKLYEPNWDMEYGPDEIYDGEFKIKGLGGRVKDACIATIRELHFMNGTGITVPIIFFLMEDGSVEWSISDMFYWKYAGTEPELNSNRLIWLKDTVSLSYEATDKEIGYGTVYAEDSNGAKYDVGKVVEYDGFAGTVWVSSIYDVDYSYEDLNDCWLYRSGYYLVFNFSEDGSVVLEKGWVEEGEPARYKGKYHVSIEDSSEKMFGVLSLDLTLESAGSTKNADKKIESKFFTDIDYVLGGLSLAHYQGDFLYTDENGAWEHMEFGSSFESPFRGRID